MKGTARTEPDGLSQVRVSPAGDSRSLLVSSAILAGMKLYCGRPPFSMPTEVAAANVGPARLETT
jgi:hypothetical protein